eukprot:scaffold268018_cov21-Tisochrysis_lutea.AAC.1
MGASKFVKASKTGEVWPQDKGPQVFGSLLDFGHEHGKGRGSVICLLLSSSPGFNLHQDAGVFRCVLCCQPFGCPSQVQRTSLLLNQCVRMHSCSRTGHGHCLRNWAVRAQIRARQVEAKGGVDLMW